jgi:hypothetical protein
MIPISDLDYTKFEERVQFVAQGEREQYNIYHKGIDNSLERDPVKIWITDDKSFKAAVSDILNQQKEAVRLILYLEKGTYLLLGLPASDI